MKMTMPKMKNVLNEINYRLDNTEEKMNEIEDVKIETIQDKTHREQRIKK